MRYYIKSNISRGLLILSHALCFYTTLTSGEIRPFEIVAKSGTVHYAQEFLKDPGYVDISDLKIKLLGSSNYVPHNNGGDVEIGDDEFTGNEDDQTDYNLPTDPPTVSMEDDINASHNPTWHFNDDDSEDSGDDESNNNDYSDDEDYYDDATSSSSPTELGQDDDATSGPTSEDGAPSMDDGEPTYEPTTSADGNSGKPTGTIASTKSPSSDESTKSPTTSPNSAPTTASPPDETNGNATIPTDTNLTEPTLNPTASNSTETGGTESNSTDASGKEANSTDSNGPETNTTDTNGAETNTTNTTGIDSNATDTNGGETNTTDTNGGEINTTDTSGIDSNATDTNGGETNTTDTNGAETNTADTSGIDSNATDTNGGETNTTDTNGAETNTTDTSAIDSNTTDINDGETNTTDTNGAETNTTDTSGIDSNATDTNGGETNTTDTSAIDSNATDTNGGKTNTTDTNGGETNTTDTSAIDSNATDTNGTETNTTDTNGGETNTTDTSAIDSNATDTNGAETNTTDNGGETNTTDTSAIDSNATDTNGAEANTTDTNGGETNTTETIDATDNNGDFNNTDTNSGDTSGSETNSSDENGSNDGTSSSSGELTRSPDVSWEPTKTWAKTPSTGEPTWEPTRASAKSPSTEFPTYEPTKAEDGTDTWPPTKAEDRLDTWPPTSSTSSDYASNDVRKLDGNLAGSYMDVLFFQEPPECANSKKGCDWPQLGIGLNEKGGERYCCTHADVISELCTKEDILIIDKKKYDEVGEHKLIFLPDDGSLATINEGQMDTTAGTGKYTLAMALCNSKGRDVSISGDVLWKSKHGYLPGELTYEYGFSIFIMVVYFCLIGWYAYSMKKYRDASIGIQNWILVSILLGLVEMVLNVLDFTVWNNNGSRQKFVIYAWIFFGGLEGSISRCLLVMVSMGWGVVRDTIGDKMKKIIIAGILYTILCFAEDYLEIYTADRTRVQERQEFGNETQFFRVFLGFSKAIMELTFYIWILDSLNGTMQYLENMNQSMKLKRYLRLRLILLLSILFSLIVIIYTFVDGSDDSHVIGNGDQWAVAAAWNANYMFILIGVAVLWRPNPDAKQYAYVMELPSIGGGRDMTFDTHIDSFDDNGNKDNITYRDVQNDHFQVDENQFSAHFT